MRVLLTGAAMAGVLAVAACEGDNLFSVAGKGGTTSADAKAPVVDITVPRGDSLSGTAIGDSVFVSVHVTDKVGVKSLKLRGFALRGDAGLGTAATVDRFAEKTVDFTAAVKDTTLNRYLLAASDSTREKAYVVVEAKDSAGNVGADTASLSVGGPVVQLPGLVSGAVISSGASLKATIKAADPKGVNQLRLDITGSLDRSVVKTLGTSLASAQLDTSVAIPDTAAGPILVRAAGRNTLGVLERTAGVELFIADRKPPTSKILLPRGDSLSAKPLGDSVLVTARFTDNFGVRSVRMRGVAKRGDKNLGTDTVVTRFVERAITFAAGVRDTTISRYLRATKDSTKETAQILVLAADSAGNQSSDTVNLVLGGPDVEILDVVNGQSIQAGLTLAIRVRAEDPLGITQIRVEVKNAVNAVLVKSITPPLDSMVLDTILAIPATALGTMQITAIARNTLDVSGQDGPLSMNVVPAGAGDTIRPSMTHVATAPQRMELQDSVILQVTGSDVGRGIVKAGYTVLAISPTRGDTLIRTDSTVYDPARTGKVTRFFSFGPFNVDSLSLPDTLVYEIHSWMRDGAGNCSVSVGADSLVSLPCDTLRTHQTVAKGRTGQRLTRSIVAGKTVRLPTGGKIMDAAVDTARKRLYLSNIETNRLEVFDLGSESFRTAIQVGSKPWGLAFSRNNDSLWVANSGGVNLSVVDLDAQKESNDHRLLTPDVLLFNVEFKTGDSGAQYIITPLPGASTPSFADEPQFMAVDSFGNVLYSTVTNPVGDFGTARKGFYTPGWKRSEVKIFVEHAAFEPVEDFYAVAHVDSITSTVDTLVAATDSLPAILGARMAIFDHVPGFPDSVISGTANSEQAGAVSQAAAELKSKGSDALVVLGTKWNIPSLTFKDTTYVAGSGDGGWVAFGEGGASPTGRVLVYQAKPGATTALSAWTQVSNLLTNAAEQVRGVGLNYDGTLGVIRGSVEAYFITPEDLLKQGSKKIEFATQGSGAVLHPLHANGRTVNHAGQYRPDTHLAFVGSGARTVDIIDTWHFETIGRVYLRDVITGPLRAVLPFPADNAAYRCATIAVTDRNGKYIGDAVKMYDGETPIAPDGATEDRCIVLKLFAPTSGGGVVVIDVRKADVLRYHPARR